jgi:TP901 family phage tail tape measure protein
MSVITTGINIVATGVSRSINDVKRFGQTLTQTHRQAQKFANGYGNSTKSITKTSTSLSRALNQNWNNMYKSAMSSTKNQKKALEQLENMYDRTFREIGNKYQSMVMGSVALSMSGIGIMGAGQATLGAMKTSLDQARDFETVMSQIQFYGHRTAEEMKTIKKEIFQLGYDLPVKTSEIANSVLSAQKLGYDNVKDATKMAEEASKIQFMSLGKMDGEESLKYISHMRKLIGYTVEDTDKLTDKLTKTADVSAASIDSLWKTIQSSRTAFDSLGGNEDTFLTLTGVMADRLTPRNAGLALNSFAGGVQMAEKAGREDRGTRGEYYNQLKGAIGGGLDDFNGDILKYIEKVATKSKELWGEGSQRKGILQSMFGKSALDLFYAVDAYMGKTGRTMTQMRDEIANAEGHSQKLMDTLMNGSYGTEQRLAALVEQFHILFGTTIRPMFNAILEGLSFVLTKINQFIEKHPKIAKVLGYGAGIAGMLLVATGATMLFVGGLLAIYASLNNIIVQLARNTRVLNLLSAGYSSAGQMIKAQMLGPLGLLGKNLLKVSGITFFLWLAWKNDFFRMRTTFLEWKRDIGKGLKESSKMFKWYGEESAILLNQSFKNNQHRGLEGWVANSITKARMLWDGVTDIWKDGTISPAKHQMLQDAGLLGIVEKVYEIKTAAIDFWNGFEDGLKDGIELLKDLLGPLLDVWEWLSDKILKVFQHFGYFENVNKGIGTKWEQWGQTFGYLVGSAIAIRVALWGWLKAAKLITSPFRMMFSFTKGIWGLLKKMKGIKFNPFKALAKTLLPKQMQGWLNTGMFMNQKRKYGKQGAHSKLPYARPVIDPTTGKPIPGQVTYQKKWYQRNKKGQTIIPGKNGTSGTLRSRGLFGRMRDGLFGRVIEPEQKVDKKGRTYHQIRTPDGRTMRSNADGRVKGKKIRAGGFIRGYMDFMGAGYDKTVAGGKKVARGGNKIRGNASLMNMINFMDAGMDYNDSKGRRGHKRRSIKAGVKGFWNRSRQQGISADGNTLRSKMKNASPDMRKQAGLGKGRIGKLFNFSTMFKGVGTGLLNAIKSAGKGIGKLAPTIGKGLIKGLGTVVTKGLPLLFKGAFRLIPYVGWALLAWDAISLIFSNWDTIKSAGSKAWSWIKEKGLQAWNWMKTDGIMYMGMAWDWIKGKAGEAWDWVKTKASQAWDGVWNWAVQKFWGIVYESELMAMRIVEKVKSYCADLFSPITDAWDKAKAYVEANPIVQAVKTVTGGGDKDSGGGGIWKGVKRGASHLKNKFIPSFRTGLWNVPKDNYMANLHGGEMVLTRKEAQIMRSLVGSDSNSISNFLLDKNKTNEGIKAVAKMTSSKAISRARTMAADSPAPQESGDGSSQAITFNEGAILIQVQSMSSPADIKRGAKQMYEEFKRLVELDNMKNYKPARPRKARPV